MAPVESVHALSPDPPAPSTHEKFVATDWLRPKV